MQNYITKLLKQNTIFQASHKLKSNANINGKGKTTKLLG